MVYQRLKMLSIPPINHPASLADLTYETLKEFVLSPKAHEIIKLEERTLAKQLGISRTPLREALNRLICEGFLRVEPRKGVFINHPNKKEIIEILYVRAALESMAARLAVANATSADLDSLREILKPFGLETVEKHVEEFSIAHVEFHEKSIELSGCKKLIELASNIRDQMKMVRIWTMRLRGRAKDALIEHLEIVDALEGRNPDVAASTVREHILSLVHYVGQSTAGYPWNQPKNEISNVRITPVSGGFNQESMND